MDYLAFFITCLYFYFPVSLANVGANLGRLVPILKDIKQPIDFGKKIRGTRIIGDHKNFGGFIAGVLFGTLWGIVKTLLMDPYMGKYILINENKITLIFLYFLMSVAALCGDLVKSVAKRVFNRPPHTPWIPFDEIDHTLVSMLVVKLIFPISWGTFVAVIIIYFFIHMMTNLVGYLLKLKDVPY